MQNGPGCDCGVCAYCVSHGRAMVVPKDSHLHVTGFDKKKK